MKCNVSNTKKFKCLITKEIHTESEWLRIFSTLCYESGSTLDWDKFNSSLVEIKENLKCSQ
jgi:hypothetical protein